MHASLNEDSPYGFDVFALFTRLEGVKGVAPVVRYPRGIGFEPSHPEENWLARQDLLREYVDLRGLRIKQPPLPEPPTEPPPAGTVPPPDPAPA